MTGPSGAGKGTLIGALLERIPGLEMSVSATTRAPRPGEVEGRDYYFLSPEDFERRVRDGDFLEHVTYAEHRYGTLRSELDRPARGLVLEIEVQGARQRKEAFPEAMGVFIAPPSIEALRERLLARGTDSREQVESRLATAEDELRAREEFEHVVVNDDRQRAADELVGLVARMWNLQPPEGLP